MCSSTFSTKYSLELHCVIMKCIGDGEDLDGDGHLVLWWWREKRGGNMGYCYAGGESGRECVSVITYVHIVLGEKTGTDQMAFLCSWKSSMC